jgi:hypothetical protein
MICLSLAPGNETPASVPVLRVCASLSYQHRRSLNLSIGTSLLQLRWEGRLRIHFQHCNPVNNKSLTITQRFSTAYVQSRIWTLP